MSARPESQSKKPRRGFQPIDPAKTLDAGEIRKLRSWAGARAAEGDRDATIILVMLGTGARRFEAGAFVCGNFYRTATGPVVHFEVAKGNVESRIPISEATWTIVQRWIAFKRQRGEPTGPHAPVFASQYGDHLSNAALHKLIVKAMAAAGLKKRKGRATHALRHATALLIASAEGGDLRKAKDMLRHRSIRTTQRHYEHIVNEEAAMRDAIRKAGL